MSRTIEVDEDLKLISETISSMEECKHLCNEVCCNDMCDQCGQLVDSRFCSQKCPQFTKEDGIIVAPEEEGNHTITV